MIKLTPPAHRLLVKPDPLEDEVELKKHEALSRAGLEIIKPDNGKVREKKAATKGTIVAIGWTAWKAIDGSLEEWKPWCKVGDRIMFGRYAGELIEHPETKEEFMILNDEDVLLILEEDNG